MGRGRRLRVELDDLGVGPLRATMSLAAVRRCARRGRSSDFFTSSDSASSSAETLGGHVERLGDRRRDRRRPRWPSRARRRRRRRRGAAMRRSTSCVELLLGEVACAPRAARPKRARATRARRCTAAASFGRLPGSFERSERTNSSMSDVTQPRGALALGGSGVFATWAKAASVADSNAKTGLPRAARTSSRRRRRGRSPRPRAWPAHLLRRDGLGRAEDREDAGVPVRDRRALPQAVGPEVDEGDVGTAVAVPDEDVLELEVPVRDARRGAARRAAARMPRRIGLASRMCMAPERASRALSGWASMWS